MELHFDWGREGDSGPVLRDTFRLTSLGYWLGRSYQTRPSLIVS